MPLLIHSTVPDATPEIERFITQVLERMPFAFIAPITTVAPAQNAAHPHCDWLTLPRCSAPQMRRLLDVYARWYAPAAALFWRTGAGDPSADYGQAWHFDGTSFRRGDRVYSGPTANERLLDALQARLPAILTSDTGVDFEQLERALVAHSSEVRVYLRGALTASVAHSLQRAAELAPHRIHLFLRLEQGAARPQTSLQWFRLWTRNTPLRVSVQAEKPAADRACRAVFGSPSSAQPAT